MSIIKINKSANYTVIDNKPIKDKDLSLQAKGLITFLMSLPVNFEVNKTNLHQFSKNGRDGTIKAFNELEQAGYILKEKKQGSKFGFNYTVSDIPLLKNRNGKTVTENQKQISKKVSNKLDTKNKESKETPTPKNEKETQLKTEGENPQKSCAKKGGHIFPNNEPRKTYKVDTPPTSEQMAKPYEVFLGSYSFNNWTNEIKKEFLLYCEIKHEKAKGRFSSTQCKLRIYEVNAAIEKHEEQDIIMILKAAQNGGWASFEFTERIKDRKKKKEPKKPKHDITQSYDIVKEQLNKPLF